MTIVEHLNELRKRLFIILTMLVVASLASFSYSKQILEVLTAGRTLIYIRPSEGFMAHIRLAVTAGVILSMPVFFYQVLAFAAPALSRRQKWLLFGSVLLMFVLFLSGIIFAWYVVFPLAMGFFSGFSSENLQPWLSVSEYLSFTISFLMAFGVVFQLPMLFWLLGALGIVKAKFLRASRKYALIIIFVVAAILTPPDVISQVLMALPMLLLYELGIALVSVTERRRKKRELTAVS